MSTIIEVDEDAAAARALRGVLIAWSLAFAALWIAVTARAALGDMRAAVAVMLELGVAIALGRWLAQWAWAIRDWRPRRHVPQIVVAVMMVALFLAVLDIGIAFATRSLQPRFDLRLLDQIGRPFMVYCWMFAMLMLGLRFASAQLNNRRQAVELADARAAAAQAQLAMLRYQLNPHFLFNTLNAISTLVVTGRSAAAEEMLARLSAFLRASLVSDHGDFVTLDEELSVIQEYLEIESVRFGDRLITDFAVEPEAAEVLVPSFILQPLVENAIKYGVSPSRQPVLIKVEARRDGPDLVLAVCDDSTVSPGGGGSKDGTGVGLRNIRARLAAIHGASASLEAIKLERGYLAIVRLPAYTALANEPRLAEVAE